MKDTKRVLSIYLSEMEAVEFSLQVNPEKRSIISEILALVGSMDLLCCITT